MFKDMLLHKSSAKYSRNRSRESQANKERHICTRHTSACSRLARVCLAIRQYRRQCTYVSIDHLSIPHEPLLAPAADVRTSCHILRKIRKLKNTRQHQPGLLHTPAVGIRLCVGLTNTAAMPSSLYAVFTAHIVAHSPQTCCRNLCAGNPPNTPQPQRPDEITGWGAASKL